MVPLGMITSQLFLVATLLNAKATIPVLLVSIVVDAQVTPLLSFVNRKQVIGVLVLAPSAILVSNTIEILATEPMILLQFGIDLHFRMAVSGLTITLNPVLVPWGFERILPLQLLPEIGKYKTFLGTINLQAFIFNGATQLPVTKVKIHLAGLPFELHGT